MYFISVNKLSGIGQVVLKYSQLLKNSRIVEIDEHIPAFADVFFFMLPVKPHIDKLRKLIDLECNVIVMTVCETETVHESYGEIFKIQKNIFVPSEFCKKVFERQFDCQCQILRHSVPHEWPVHNDTPASPYIFYHIGNIIDPRKQVGKIIQAFQELNLPNAKLVLKATCIKEVQLNVPNVQVINGLLDEEQLKIIHHKCHCYVSFSHSEGVGMGAVEAALHNRPVIITNYGGCSEYVNTPFLIDAPKGPIGFDDFLYKKDMEWGHPKFNQLKEFMKECYNKRITYWNHEHTHKIVSVKLEEFL